MRKDIESREQQWLTAFNGGDASGVAALYRNDARVLPPNSELVAGRSNIEAFVKEFVQTGAQLSFELLTVHEAPNLCAAVGTYAMAFPSGSGIPADAGKFVEVWVRDTDGTWSIADDIFNSSLPAPTTA